jgi:hypothetical protein
LSSLFKTTLTPFSSTSIVVHFFDLNSMAKDPVRVLVTGAAGILFASTSYVLVS